ncbi:MAG: protein-export chaperone SecB [Woeseiaceae bacterium]|jgi:preprotein translocase subunit SecB|nr:protein-export chaperone SecB [Woeseiaceae bacterium]|tara:strand:- start:399 stop:887 length:489 start_codon:yes stop_codon:yes gene_type:complete
MSEEETPTKQIIIQKLYIKDASFESPNTPNVFKGGEWNPKTDLNLSSSHVPYEDDTHEVVLTITVEAKDEDNVIFLVELKQAGLFQISGYEEKELETIIGIFCPNTLFPYARESIANIITKGGFPEFLLQPINFDALYNESKKRAASPTADIEDKGASETTH